MSVSLPRSHGKFFTGSQELAQILLGLSKFWPTVINYVPLNVDTDYCENVLACILT